jgi:hypothetical protein
VGDAVAIIKGEKKNLRRKEKRARIEPDQSQSWSFRCTKNTNGTCCFSSFFLSASFFYLTTVICF